LADLVVLAETKRAAMLTGPPDGAGSRTNGVDQDPIAPEPSPAPSGFKSLSAGESDDAYPSAVHIDHQTRVIVCPDGIQWIVQRLQGGQWRGVSYHRNRDALIGRIIERFGSVHATALAKLKLLPEWL
jgi:hypothetical protein